MTDTLGVGAIKACGREWRAIRIACNLPQMGPRRQPKPSRSTLVPLSRDVRPRPDKTPASLANEGVSPPSREPARRRAREGAEHDYHRRTRTRRASDRADPDGQIAGVADPAERGVENSRPRGAGGAAPQLRRAGNPPHGGKRPPALRGDRGARVAGRAAGLRTHHDGRAGGPAPGAFGNARPLPAPRTARVLRAEPVDSRKNRRRRAQPDPRDGAPPAQLAHPSRAL